MRVESSGKPDAWKLARPVWGWGRGATPRPTPRDGLTLYYRRLEEGTFRFPTSDDPQAWSIEISCRELSLVLWGIDPASVKRQKRYVRAG